MSEREFVLLYGLLVGCLLLYCLLRVAGEIKRDLAQLQRTTETRLSVLETIQLRKQAEDAEWAIDPAWAREEEG